MSSGGANAQGGGYSMSASNTYEDNTARSVQYSCAECDNKVKLSKGDPVRCKECGHRVLYKERTNRMVQFEAR